MHFDKPSYRITALRSNGNSLVWVWLSTYCHRTQLNAYVGVGWGTGSTNFFFIILIIWYLKLAWQKYGKSKFKSAQKKPAVNYNFGTSGSTSTCCDSRDSSTCNCGNTCTYMHRSIHLTNGVLIRCMNNIAVHVHFAHKLIMLIFHWCL